MLVYASTIFTSAFLLFLVQPIITKMILPWFGGSASVWTTCMLFFQGTLLLGYLYSHWSIRTLKPKAQFLLHAGLLAVSFLVLPIIPAASWKPAGTEDPTFRIWGLLAVSVGMPYFLLSTTGPLIQAWYARTHRQAVPYRLFALSNLGSMLALMSYPVVVEPFVASRWQSIFWSGGYVVFTLLCAGAAWRASHSDLEIAPVEAPAVEAPTEEAPAVEPAPVAQPPEQVTWRSVAIWIALPACASWLLLAVTNHMCQDIASIPFLWILPLALYLLSFILCFDREGWYRPRLYEWLVAAALGGMCWIFFERDATLPLQKAIPILSAGLLVCCMFCHGEVARQKPHSRHLTLFYLMISLGGALGSLFVALVAPRAFHTFYEFPLGLVLCAALALVVNRRDKTLYYCWVAVALVMCFYIGKSIREDWMENRVMARNFYGALRVSDSDAEQGPDKVRKLLHGAINHGEQFLNPARRHSPTTYYGPASGVGLSILQTRRSAQRVGMIGLGTGTISVYGKPGDYYRIYEINPLVLKLANSEFSYLRECQAKVDVVLGDARLSLERDRPQNFDVLAVDAFAGDSIPVHLLTREAFELYFRHLKPDGILAVHVSNKYLDLEPVVKRLADYLRKPARLTDDEGNEAEELFGSTWVLVTSNQAFLDKPEVKKGVGDVQDRATLRMWTDDYSNLFRILK